MKISKARKNDIFLICTVLAFALAALLLSFVLLNNDGEFVTVTVNGKEYAKLPLNKDCELVIEGENGERNLLTIKDGSARITKASCENQICVNSGAVSFLKPIICSPNRVIVSIEEDGAK